MLLLYNIDMHQTLSTKKDWSCPYKMTACICHKCDQSKDNYAKQSSEMICQPLRQSTDPQVVDLNQVKRHKVSDVDQKAQSGERKRGHKKSRLLAQVEDMFRELEASESEHDETSVTEEKLDD